MGSAPLHLADRYRLCEQIGTGRFATVWLAWDEVLARLVAVKVLRASRAAVPGFRARFLEQVRKAARLSHPATVTIHDFGESEGPGGAQSPFVVMELLSGEVLATRLRRGPLPPREALRVCGRVASALAHAHAAGTPHYDLKAGNVLLTDDGPKVLDFGIGKLVGMPVGDAAAEDVHALGLLLSAAVTGRADSETELPAPVPHEVAAVHAQCLLPDPAARPSAAEVATVLAGPGEPYPSAVVGGAPAPPTMPGRAGPLAERARRAVRRPPHALRHTAVVLSALVVVAISAPALWGGSPERALPPPTVEATAPTNDSGTATVSAGPPPSSTDGATRSPSVPAGPGTVPTPMTGPDPTRKADPTRPRPAPPADPVEVLSRAQRAVGQGVAAGEIRSDVGVDLDNVLGNLRRDLRQDHSVDLRARLAEIHNKIDTRLGEDALTPSRAERLHAILNEIRD